MRLAFGRNPTFFCQLLGNINFGKMCTSKNGKMSYFIMKSCSVLKNNNRNHFYQNPTVIEKWSNFRALLAIFLKNGYPRKWQNVIFDDEIMLSIEKQQ